MVAPANWLTSEELTSVTEVTAREIVKRAEAKLGSLEARRAHLRRRIRALNFLLKTWTLQTGAQSREAGLGRSLHRDSQSEEPAFLRQQTDHTTRSGPVVCGTTKLRRACRIALMEAAGPETSMQILHRIQNRQSIAWGNHSDAQAAIDQELQRMLSEGEVAFSWTGNYQTWQLNRR